MHRQEYIFLYQCMAEARMIQYMSQEDAAEWNILGQDIHDMAVSDHVLTLAEIVKKFGIDKLELGVVK